MTDEEKAAAAEAEEKAKDEAASAAAAELARRKAASEAERRAAADTPVRMVDLHDVRAELRAELDKVRRAESVRHAVPTPTPTPAQRGRGKRVGAVLAVVFVVALVVLGLAKGRRQ